MAIGHFLAMTAAEIAQTQPLPPKIAWLSCHFSSEDEGISGLPDFLPSGSLLILDDAVAPKGHDPETITKQLRQCIESLCCFAVLLDFQRPDSIETTAMAQYLTKALSCPVAVSDLYAKDCTGPVFLPPAAPSVPLQEHLLPWKDRELWLDIAPIGQTITLTDRGSHYDLLCRRDWEAEGFPERELHCHYHIQCQEDHARFTLWRTREDLKHLAEEAEALGVTTTVGLYQELFP